MIQSLLREPLLHFLLLSLGVFVFSWKDSGALGESDSTIRVEEADIARYMQSIDVSLNPAAAAQKYRLLPADQKQHLLRQYVENEAMYREALRLGLDQDDTVVRQRMIQRMRFMLQGFTAAQDASDEELSDYMAKNSERYRIPAKISFKHQFFKADEDDDSLARTRSLTAMDSQDEGAGDAFPYHKAYLDRTREQISQHFGAEFAAAVMQLDANPTEFQGPIESAFGTHIVKVTSTYAARQPTLADIEKRVRADYEREQRLSNESAALANLLTRYQIIEDL